MEKMTAAILSLLITSTVFAATPKVRCERELYSAALSNLVKVNLETKGVTVKLGDIQGMENTFKSYSVSLEMSDSTGITRYDSYVVVLKDMTSCMVKSSRLQAD